MDTNRDAGSGEADFREGGVTPAAPDYVRHPRDRELLLDLHHRYRRLAEEAYAAVCGAGGLALTLHTFAPRSVGVDRLDDGIVAALREAYAPERWQSWPERPEVELITEDAAGRSMTCSALAEAVARSYAADGREVGWNRTYRLHPSTLGWQHARRWPGRVLCLELRRDLLADPFVPFVEVTIGEEKLERMSVPLAAAILDTLASS